MLNRSHAQDNRAEADIEPSLVSHDRAEEDADADIEADGAHVMQKRVHCGKRCKESQMAPIKPSVIAKMLANETHPGTLQLADVGAKRTQESQTAPIKPSVIAKMLANETHPGTLQLADVKNASVLSESHSATSRLSPPMSWCNQCEETPLLCFFFAVLVAFLMCIVFFTLAVRRLRPDREDLAGKLRHEETTESEESDHEWVEPQVLSNFLRSSSEIDVDIIDVEWAPSTVRAVLDGNGIDTNQWTDKHVSDMAAELAAGKARICSDGSRIVRMVDVVMVLVLYEPEDLVLQEVAHSGYKRDWSSSTRNTIFDSWSGAIKSRLRSTEGLMSCVARCLREKLQLDTVEGIAHISSDILNLKEKVWESQKAAPGLITVERIFVVTAKIITTDKAELAKLGIIKRSLTTDEYIGTWEQISSMPHVQRHLQQQWSNVKNSGHCWRGLNYAYVPVLPWTKEEVVSVLSKHNLVSDQALQFGKTVEELTFLLSHGEVMLCVRKSNPSTLACLREHVSLVVESHSGQLLVSEDAENVGRPNLPTTQKFSNESIWNAAMRLAQMDTRLMLSVPLFGMDAHVLGRVDIDKRKDDFNIIVREYIVKGPKLPYS